MANQFNRLNYVAGKGAYLRLIYKPNPLSESCNLVLLNSKSFTWEKDPRNTDATEADSMGDYLAPTLMTHVIRVDLRRRQNPMSLDALGIMAIPLVDRVIIDIGTTGYCNIIDHMAVDVYNFNSPQMERVEEGFSLRGGSLLSSNVAIPSYAMTSGTIPDLSAYYVAGGSVPSGL